MNKPSPSLSIIIPVRAKSPDEFLPRLALRDQCCLDGVTTILIDDGSPKNVSEALAAFCETRGWLYVFEDSRNLAFSLSRARNIGANIAQTEWIFLDDADILYSATFFSRLKVELSHLHRTPLSFVSVPVVYLTQRASAQILTSSIVEEAALTTAMMFENPLGSEDNSLVESFAPASALLAVRKETLQSVGGYSTDFIGWGGEDRDFIFRLIAANPRLPRPKNVALTTSTNLNIITEYSSWRALYRLHGDYLARKGMYAFHCWHADRIWKRQPNKQNNLNLAKKKAQVHMQDVSTHTASLDLSAAEPLRRSLLFSVFDLDRPRRQYLRRSLGQRTIAKSYKFKNDPIGFFADSQSLLLRIIAAAIRKFL